MVLRPRFSVSQFAHDIAVHLAEHYKVVSKFLFLLQLLVVQFDFVVESRRSLMLSAAGAEGEPLRSP